MDSPIITEALLAQVQHLLETETCFDKESIAFEIQEDGHFVVISIAIDALPETQHVLTFKRVALLLNAVVPSRSHDDSWMVIFTKAREVVDSYFGGNLASPNLGL